LFFERLFANLIHIKSNFAGVAIFLWSPGWQLTEEVTLVKIAAAAGMIALIRLAKLGVT
jgi:hypothetical protein